MSTTSTTGVTRINRKEARVLASAEFERFAALSASLIPEEWATDTDCVGWDVRKMVLHVLGSADAQASPLVFLHQLRRGLPLNKEIDSHHWVDGLNELRSASAQSSATTRCSRSSRQSAGRRSKAGSALHYRCATPRSRSATRSAGSR